MAYQWVTLDNQWRVLYSNHIPWGDPVYHGLITRERLLKEEKFEWKEPPDFSRQDPEAYQRRRRLFQKILDASEWGWCSLNQVHSRKVVWNPTPGETPTLEADGMLSDRSEIFFTVTVADCLPIWIVDSEIGVVGILHAGWRSTVSGIMGEALEILLAQGSALRKTHVVIGPGLQKCCFEVGIEVLEALHDAYPDVTRFVVSRHHNRWYVDLVALNVIQARKYRLGRHQIHPIRVCTRCNPHLFYSHRLGDKERMLAFIGQKS